MKTVAVVCDNVIECHNNQDERPLCLGVKNNTVPYILSCVMGMFYVILKLLWWFHQRHLPLDDEDEDDEVRME